MSRLSICIGTRNRADRLARHLAHIATFETLDYEVVVSDNCSDDHTSDVVEAHRDKLKQLYYTRQTRPLSFYETIIAPCQLAVGDYVMFVADDDLLVEAGLLEAIHVLDEYEQIAAVYGGWERISEETREVLSKQQNWAEGLVIPRDKMDAALQSLWIIELPIFRRDVFLKSHTPIQHQYPFDLYGLALFMRHGDVYLMPETVVQVLAHDEQESSKLYREDITHCYIADFEMGMSQCPRLSEQDSIAATAKKIAQHYVIAGSRAAEHGAYSEARSMYMRAMTYRHKEALERIVPLAEQYSLHVAAENIINLTDTAQPVDRILVETAGSCSAIANIIEQMRPSIHVDRRDQAELEAYPYNDREFLFYHSRALVPQIEARLGRPLRKLRQDRDLLDACRILPS